MYIPVKYGTAVDLYVSLVDDADDTILYDTAPTQAGTNGDITASIDGGSPSKTGITVTKPQTKSIKLALTSAVTTGKIIHIIASDETATKAFKDDSWVLLTYGHTSAFWPFDLGSSTVTLADDGLTAAKIANDAGTEIAAAVVANATMKKAIQALCGKSISDTSANTIKIYDTDQVTLLYTLTLTTAGTVRTLTPS